MLMSRQENLSLKILLYEQNDFTTVIDVVGKLPNKGQNMSCQLLVTFPN